MVDIDTVYQKVLAFANKEQRGYITPQEFNLYADQAQKEIFEQYFYDLEQYNRLQAKKEEYVDAINRLNEKINIFETVGEWEGKTADENCVLTPIKQGVYRLGTIYLDQAGGKRTIINEVQPDEIIRMLNSPLTSPSMQRPVHVKNNYQNATSHTMTVYPYIINSDDYSGGFTYIKHPSTPKWGYFVISGKALYNQGAAENFELHSSEETELVYKILKFAGVSMKREDISQSGQGLESLQIQQEKQ
jgi:hypothetical protein